MPRRTQNPATTTKSNRESSAADAVEMLTEDHRKVELLFKKFITTDQSRKEDVARQIFKELDVHAALEEELFYPALQTEGDLEELGSLAQGDIEINGANVVDHAEIMQDDEDDEDDEDGAGEETGEDTIDAAYEEHQAVKEFIGRLKDLETDSPDFREGMDELKDMVMEHVAEEEEVLFAAARLTLDTKSLGRQMQQRKQELLSSLSS